MTDEEIIQLIEDEFQNKTLGVTEQYLEIHSPVIVDDKLKIERVDREQLPELIIAYLPVDGQYFSFAVYIDPQIKKIINIGTESRNELCLRATSDTLNALDMQAFTVLKPSQTWNKGEYKSNGKVQYAFSAIEFSAKVEPDAFPDKLKKLLYFLLTDKQGIITLGYNADVFIHAHMDFHYGNQLLGTVYADLDCIQMLSELNIALRIDIAAWGNPFK